jgi:hypothetical protein
MDKIVGGVGVVRVGNLEITITPLTMVGERSLGRQLRAAAEAAASDYFTRCAKLLAAMKGQPAAYKFAVERIVDNTCLGPKVSEDQFWEYRDSPAGAARELFARGKKATPGLDLASLAAIITDENVDDVIEQMKQVVKGDDPNPSTP